MPYDISPLLVQLLIACIWFAAGFFWGRYYQIKKELRRKEAEWKNLQYFRKPRSRQ